MGNTDNSGNAASASDRSSNPNSAPNLAQNPAPNPASAGGADRKIDIQQELNKIEEMILDSPRVPLTGRTLIDEEPILDVLDLVRLNLPGAFQAAEEVLRQKDEILRQAEQYGRDVVDAAEKQAVSILDEMGLVRQAKAEADRIREQIKADCDAAQERTIAEIERMRQQAKHEAEELKMKALADARSIEAGADEYAERVLKLIEQQLGDMMRVVHNGRQQLQQDASYRAHRQEALHQAQQLQQAQNAAVPINQPPAGTNPSASMPPSPSMPPSMQQPMPQSTPQSPSTPQSQSMPQSRPPQ